MIHHTVGCGRRSAGISGRTAGSRSSRTSSTLTFTIDPSYTKNNAAGQRDNLVAKMKKDIDK